MPEPNCKDEPKTFMHAFQKNSTRSIKFIAIINRSLIIFWKAWVYRPGVFYYFRLSINYCILQVLKFALHACMYNAGSTSGSSPQQQNLTCGHITCREGFYCREDANNSYVYCNPSCHTWKQYPHSTNIAIDFLVLTSVCIGVISGVGVLVVAGIRWKNVYEIIFKLLSWLEYDRSSICCIITKSIYFVP